MPRDSYCVHVHELELLAHVGVTGEERARAQRLVLNITIWPRAQLTGLADDITATVNYSAVARETQELVRDHSVRLIETLAADIAARLFEVFSIARVEVEIRKFVLPGASYVAVNVVRDADE